MASKFITNTDPKTMLSDRVQYLTKRSSQLDFLVGYFFFSGFCEIAKDIKDKPLRILVGMDAEVDLNNCIVEYTTNLGNKQNTDSRITIKNKYFDNLRKIINKADVLDSETFENSYHIFCKKLEDGTLEVRKTKDPNHAKMYLFYIPPENSDNGIDDDSKLIVGSSNFSIQGFKARNEINVYLQDENDFKDGKKIFENLWEDAFPLVNKDNAEDFKKDVLFHTWLETFPSPYLMYIRVLYEYFKTTKDYIKSPLELTKDRMNQYFDVSYQVDAIREGVAKVKKHSGCIVADVVGLGKSIIASAIAANLDKRTVIVTPPHLKAQWEEYASDFGLRGCDIYTSGKLEEAARQNKNQNDLVIIIDEAHRYRNENTEAYGFLHQLCAGNQVILLSATPFNNRPEDIFSLIKLFQIPTKSTIQTVNNLGNQMLELVKEYKDLQKKRRNKKADDKVFAEESKKLAERIREILDPVVIRRTRVDLELSEDYKFDLKAQGILFSDVKPPKSQNYDLGDLTDLYKKTLTLLTDENKGFKGARYKPMTYLKDNKGIIAKYTKHFEVKNFQTGQRNMAKFMQQLLVRRFESSKFSFVKTLENVQNSMKNLLRWLDTYKKIPLYKKGKFPDLDDMDELTESVEESLFDLDDMLQTAYSKDMEKGLIFVDSEDIMDDFRKELLSDINLFDEFLSDWNKVKKDPKLNFIETSIKTSLQKEPERKIIIFTEYSDTADYLSEEFKKAGLRSMMYSSKIASKSGRDALRANFDAGWPKNMQKDEYDVLIATDAISEGFSLHRAGTIYNYDIPYNPTRVIQRVGRINRINKKVFDELYIYNFFPTATGEEISHTAEISTFKMKLFQAILGADTQILTEDETIDGYLGEKFKEAQNEGNSVSWNVEFKNELARIKREDPKSFQKAIDLPQRCRIGRKNINYNVVKNDSIQQELFEDIQEKGVLLFSKKGDSYRFCFTAQDGTSLMVNPQQALTLFKAKKDELGEHVSDSFYSLYEKSKAESGVVKLSSKRSKANQEAIGLLKYLIQNAKSESDKEYVKSVCDVISWDSIPLYYTKQISKINIEAGDVLGQLKEIIPDTYLNTLIEKEHKVGSEPETILLAEELK